ncbi:MAG TPA: hypothetical protein VFE00_08985 [Arthrobacter sp.]|nr:hypothetical protein [Arthrobacter sp.]
MAAKLNKSALRHARQLIKDSKVVRDVRDNWSEHAPDTEQENTFIKKHGFAEYAKWHLGEDEETAPDAKGRYKFPYGDFQQLHRCGVIAVETRAAQNDYDDIAEAAKSLLAELDKD